MGSKMYKFCFYVPETHLEAVKAAVFAAGAGLYRNYDSCCWQALGVGQFRPLKGSRPFFGKLETLEVVSEYKVETICSEDVLDDVVRALREAHPYEEPLFEFFPINV